MWFLVTALKNKIKLLFQLTEKVLLNETIIISNREAFNYEHKGREKHQNLHDNQNIKQVKKHQYHWYWLIMLICLSDT